jgi:hypothetical protein
MPPLPTLAEMAVYLHLGCSFVESFDFVMRDREMADAS